MCKAKWLIGLAILFALSACNRPDATAPSKAPAASFNTSLTMRQLMDWVLDPNADFVWASVATIITEEGQQEIAPQTDEEWDAVRNRAALLVEAGNLLMLEGRAVNNDDWMHKARAFSDAAKVVLDAAQAKDAPALFTAGSDMYLTCSGCHAIYIFDQETKAGSAAAKP